MIDSAASPQLAAPAPSRDRPIPSAEAVTFMRALLARRRDPRERNPDHLAETFLSWRWKAMLLAGRRLHALVERRAPGCYGFHLARTRHIDGLLLEAIAAGATQVVILGAGNDSRAYRFRRELAGARIFELDLPATQARKKERLTAKLGHLPDNVTFLPIDFNRQPLDEVLAAGGYDPRRRTFFNWEGVSFFLHEPAVVGLLRIVAQGSASGSTIVFDYALRSFVGGDRNFYGAEELARWLSRAGEPHHFGIEDGQVGVFLGEQGLELVSDLGPDDLESTYLERQDGTRVGRVYGMFRLAHARVPDPPGGHLPGTPESLSLGSKGG